MKLNPKKLSVLTLAMVFAMFSFYCCCVPQAVEAAKVPSCHETHEQESEQHNDECCQKPPVVTADKAFSLETFTGGVLITFSEIPQRPIVSYPIQYSSKSFLDTSPLYLKHSVLRL